jgi:hypothetical protein
MIQSKWRAKNCSRQPKINPGAAAPAQVPEILQACAVFSVIAIAGALCNHG